MTFLAIGKGLRIGGWRNVYSSLSALLSAALVVFLPIPGFTASFALAPDQTAFGAIGSYVTHEDDTLLDVARRYDLGYTQLIAANRGIDPWLPGEGRMAAIPGLYLLPDLPHRGIVINLAQQRLFYFAPSGHVVETFPIGVGVQGWVTPLGETRVTEKQIHPPWIPPPSILAEEPGLPKVVPPGPDNPLGDYALLLGWSSYLLHGTNKPYGVGRNVSHGCIRLYPEDIEKLFSEVEVGTPVRVIDERATAAWIGNDLYLAIFPDKRQIEELDVGMPMTPETTPDLENLVLKVAGDRAERVDWHAVAAVDLERSGIPVVVTRPVSEPDQATVP